jgi:hypothetical protein
MTIECPACTFEPVAELLKVVTKVANGNVDILTQYEASLSIENWKNSLATPAQIAKVRTNDDLEIDDDGACVSIGFSDDGKGFFIQTWTWVGEQ